MAKTTRGGSCRVSLAALIGPPGQTEAQRGHGSVFAALLLGPVTGASCETKRKQLITGRVRGACGGSHIEIADKYILGGGCAFS